MRRTRREFLAASAASIAAGIAPPVSATLAEVGPDDRRRGKKIGLGLVTWMWGAKQKLPELIANCEKAHCLGVELRTTHAHGVEPGLDAKARASVKERFADSPVTLVGLGSNERFDHVDPKALAKAVDATKKFVVLSHDVGGTGVKVKPNSFHPNVPRKTTIEQIGRSLHELGKFAEGFGQQIRLEAHGQCAELPILEAILNVAKHPNVVLCWNSNTVDVAGKGLAHNFGLVAERLGPTLHTRELDSKDYPYAELIDLLVKVDYEGWVMIESRNAPRDLSAALTRQRGLLLSMLEKSSAKTKQG